MKGQDKNFGEYLDRTLKVIRGKYLKAFRDHGVDITTEQWVILHKLYDNNGQSQTDLANHSFKNAPTVSRIIDLLCQKGFTTRNRFDNDRRRYKIFLTDAGKTAVEKIYPAVRQLREVGWSKLSDHDFNELTRILDQIFDNFNT